jgi:hypothetical protein
MLIDIIAGARPNFMKVGPIIAELQRRAREGGPLRYRLVHTGQHYDASMSGDFFTQLGIPQPDVNLDVGSGTQAEQAGAIMLRYERLLLENPTRLCLVVGDVTSTMACAIVAQKLRIPVAHVEAGIRSGDWSMPEEINRLVTDSITNYFFTTSEHANANLRVSGVNEDRIFFVGNTMIDSLLANMDRLRKPDFFDRSGLTERDYFVMTLASSCECGRKGRSRASHRRGRRRRPRQAGRLSGSSKNRKDAVGCQRCATKHTDNWAPALSRIQLAREARARSDHRLWRHHRGGDGDGGPVPHSARQHGEAGDHRDRHE